MQRQFQLVTSAMILVFGLTAQALAQAAAPLTAETAQRIDAVFAAWDGTRWPGCVLGVSQNGTLVYSRGYGMSNLEYGVAMAPDSIFHVASISKQFTAFLIALLAREGKLSLDDDVRRYLPELPDYGQRITIRHLLTHTSGLREQFSLLRLAGWRPDDLVTEDDVLAVVTRQKSLNFPPGTEYLYSNTGFTLLGVIVKRVSGQSLRDFAQTRIFSPLGMGDTHVHDDHTMIVRRRTSAYQPRPGGGWKISIPVFDTVGATSLFTTVGDLLKWEQNFDDARVGSRAMLDQMQLPARLNDGTSVDYGFGLVPGTYRGVRVVGHSGSDAGYRADVVRFPDQRLAIAAFCNLSTIPPDVLTRRVAEIILGPGVFAPLAPSTSVSQSELGALVGTYWNPATDDVRRLVLADGKLTMEGSPEALVPLGGGRFRLGEQPTEVDFPLPKAGTPQELHTSSPVAAVLTRSTAPSYSVADLKAYAGEYRSDELDVGFKVVVSPQGRLVVLRRKFDPVPLQTLKPDLFFSPSLGTVTFIRAAAGEVTGLTLSTVGVRRLSLTRVGVTPSTMR